VEVLRFHKATIYTLSPCSKCLGEFSASQIAPWHCGTGDEICHNHIQARSILSAENCGFTFSSSISLGQDENNSVIFMVPPLSALGWVENRVTRITQGAGVDASTVIFRRRSHTHSQTHYSAVTKKSREYHRGRTIAQISHWQQHIYLSAATSKHTVHSFNFKT
jgi:hypothetical protein